MKKYQFISVLLIISVTVYSSWIIRDLLVFAYEDYNQTNTYSVSKTLSYIRLFPTILLFFVATVYSMVIAILLKILFKNFNRKMIFQLGFLIFTWLFLNGLIGSYKGIRDYQVRKCNSNIQKCLKEEGRIK